MSDEPKLRVYAVILPIAGHAHLIVEAADERAALEKAFEEVTIDHVEDWEPMEQFYEGNVLYCPRPWEAEVTDETPDDE